MENLTVVGVCVASSSRAVGVVWRGFPGDQVLYAPGGRCARKEGWAIPCDAWGVVVRNGRLVGGVDQHWEDYPLGSPLAWVSLACASDMLVAGYLAGAVPLEEVRGPEGVTLTEAVVRQVAAATWRRRWPGRPEGHKGWAQRAHAAASWFMVA